jgi:hypothetical protein
MRIAGGGRFMLVAFAAAFAGAAAPAAPPSLRDPHPLAFDGDQRAPLAPGSDATALRMLREIYPGLTETGEAPAGMRAVRGLDPAEAELADNGPDGGGAEAVHGGEASLVRVGDDALLIVAGVLVAARVAPHYRFLDAAWVQTDPGGPPWIAHAFQGPAGPVALIGDGHNNSSESFATYQLVGLVGGRLTLLHDSLFLYSWQAPRRGCPMLQVSHSLARIAPQPGGNLVATVVEERTCDRAARPQRLGRRMITIRFLWDAARRRYRADTGALDAVSERVYRANNR